MRTLHWLWATRHCAHNGGVLVSLQRPYPASARATPQFWLWPNLLSLDAPLVAVLWQILFVRCFHVAMDAAPAILLVASVWLIYAADRALDAWRGQRSSARHRFYHAHWRILAPAWTLVLAASAWLAFTQLPAHLLWRGLILLSAVALYFFAVHGRPPIRSEWKASLRGVLSPAVLNAVLNKEATVGLLFALGVSLAAWTNVRNLVDAAAIGLFFLLCWINCAAIQKWESGSWNSAAEWPVGSAAFGVALIAGVVLCLHRPVLGGAEMASACAFVWLDRAGHRLSPEALRVLADVALLSPVVFLPLAGIV